ncbi:hypothetical protein X777_15192 [Ooceraea biroi]|uniref:USP domain-containing protein n=1 Tax=Ooceraea biroi TaxID=2015173 RepID=A0A026VW90_OOCBI|nr:hypothetical protein X777_15190 [Ooceraea biroi]EZA47776.1 hypothetical protein X777_15192 [Ooceraea biroi]
MLVKCEPQVQTDLTVVSYRIDALDNIANVVRKTLATEPSIKNTTKCTSCKGRTYPTVVLEPNHKIIGKEGFRSLEKSLFFRSPSYHIRCKDPCLGKYTLFKEPGIYIFIELDIRPNLQSNSLSCMLDRMPTTLGLQCDENTIEYRLIGVIDYTSRHYIAYCLRSNGFWQMYDDLRTSVVLKL